MRPFVHINARTMEQAFTILQKYKGRARINAGGTDLLGLLKNEFLPDYPEAIINIKTIPDLDYIKEDGDTLKIGTLAKLADIAKSSVVRSGWSVLAEAARSVASPQIRNAATIGGNLCQDVRCWYYRYPCHIGGPIQCMRKGNGPCLAVRGDNRYHAITGGKKCFAVCPSDTATAFAALDAQLVIASSESDRKVAVTDFYNPLGNALKYNEMVREIQIPNATGLTAQRFLKFTMSKDTDFAIVNVASAVAVKDGTCVEARIALGAIAPGPIRATKAEKSIIGQRIDADRAEETALLALENAHPLSQNGYKVEIAKTLVKRSLIEGSSA
jgi:xanthine dehydrogenase YagS FAD-binding subunit